MMQTAQGLFTPLTLRSVTIPNRIGVSPMCQYSALDGMANDWHLVHLGSRAVGGAGLIIAEATAVSPDGRISPRDLGLWSDEQIDGLSRVTRFIEQQGSVAGIQLAHAGRKASTAVPWEPARRPADVEGGWSPIWAPSAIAFDETAQVPEELRSVHLDYIIMAFSRAAARARKAGFHVVEIHAAHGYLIHEFLSPLTNRRTDEYGGSFENRTRLLREVVDGVRRSWPDELPVFVRISSTDWVEGGWDIEQSVRLASMLKELGVDVVDCSSGGLLPNVKMPVGPGYQVPFAERIRRESGIATAAVGLIDEASQADEIIRNANADIVLLGRELLRDPYWPRHAAQKLGVPASVPVQYIRARR
jgi:2,4-dienoyl-CoA reductase-like NADH-dependent reductase (Old Yellow Enzyme family)